ncbi:hypothetical protein PG990_013471 [Apiospora arundinis]|uniref:CVNH domain-containing protein n=1 Tax=Apiospora arundinis TaxID=335852 RepID=A0ABR2ICD2_9PEZI
MILPARLTIPSVLSQIYLSVDTVRRTKMMKRLSNSGIAVVGLMLYAQASAENFGASCEMDTVKVSGRTMTGACHPVSGELVCSSLDLNECVTNSNGQLESPGNGYFYSCRNCSNGKTTSGLLIDDPAFLHCDCSAGANDWNWPTAVIDMNTFVSNSNGRLQCGNTIGAVVNC